MKRIIPVLLALVLVLPPGAGAQQNTLEEFFDSLNLDTRDDGGWYTLMDQQGNVLMRTARHIHVGDTWIGRDNVKWEVYAVAGDNAYARSVHREQGQSLPGIIRAVLAPLFRKAVPVQEEEKVEKRIGVYNTHGAEAYVPSDGTDSDPQGGGVLDVADSLARALEEKGVETVKSEETHVPHDAGAYKRSRNTVEEMVGEGVDAVVDVHRDAVPAEEYIADGMVQIQLVVGRQNQNQAANQEFAEKLKAVADEKYPGLVKGIFAAKGNYNQDMMPTSILIEVGTHENEKEAAQESVAKFADVLAITLYGSAEAAESPARPASSSGTVWRTILWLLAIVVVGGGIFLYISAGSWPEMKRKLQGFVRGEFGDLLKGRVGRRTGDDDRLK
ncbi:MAG: stage II sporulation protein P [Firmicutes bacterium]|nr:stage II sporulation protein P [Bacillota bacterium]HOB34686.1 stage II sporulation protein P [Bacillota bacterium]HPZ91446.1 stage II sporulation protein P [Bacillota bacterium]HQE02707.1 stage II sporulation protein P [Bacillota bacterium]